MADPRTTTDAERALEADLHALEPRLGDERFATGLYRALTNRTWRRSDDPARAVALSWKRAERLVNELRERAGHPALTLEQTGGEGELSDGVEAELEALGWQSRPLDTSRHQEHHSPEPESPPPGRPGQERVPDAGDRRWSSVAEGDEARPGRAPGS